LEKYTFKLKKMKYESKNPHKQKFPLRWEINYIIDWLIVIGTVGAVIYWLTK